MFENKIKDRLGQASSIAIVGAKDKPNQPVDRVGRYLIERGFTVYPIHPIRQNVWGLETFKSIEELAKKIKKDNLQLDIICLFRASEYCLDHAKESIENSLSPSIFWLQEGIKSKECFEYIKEHNSAIEYVEDVCVKTLYEAYFPKEFDCKRCGICCSGENGIVVDDIKDLPRLLEYFNCSIEELDRKHAKIHNNKRVLRSGSDKNCLFFLENKGCTIHVARPDICRAWPYFRGNMVDKISFEMAKEDCKGIIRNASHASFQKEGIKYLKEHNLIKPNDCKSCANALIYTENELIEFEEEAKK